MTHKIDQKIVRSSVIKEKESEKVERPYKLNGTTYKLKIPEHVQPHAIYVTINDIVTDEGLRPFEIFLNSKAMGDFQWIVGITRVISAVFRKGGDVEFLVEELTSVFDPKGGWYEKGVYKQSVVAAIGDIVGEHLDNLGLITNQQLGEHEKEFIQKKLESMDENEKNEALKNAKECYKCKGKMVLMDGCFVCIECANSKCG